MNADYQASLLPRKELRPRPTSAKINLLAKPLIRKTTNNRSFDEAFSVKPSAISELSQKCSNRVSDLAYSKEVHPDYVSNRNPVWKVSESALHAVATERIKELAKNKKAETRSVTDIQDKIALEKFFYARHSNPFPVTKAALNATCSRRTKKLARPRTKRARVDDDSSSDDDNLVVMAQR